MQWRLWIASASLCALILGCSVVPANGDSGYGIGNVGVGVSGGVVSYYLCVSAPSAPLVAFVIVSDADGKQYRTRLGTTSQSCGPGEYFMAGRFTGLKPGAYRFQAACVVVSQGPALPCVNATTGLSTNFRGATVRSECHTDFSTDQSIAPQNCNGPGAAGDLTGPAQRIGQAPAIPTPKPQSSLPATPRARQSSSPTPASTPTAQASPVPTRVGQFSSTPTPAAGAATIGLSGSLSTPWFGPSVARAFFAEGYTGLGYQEYLSLLNPHAHAVNARVAIYRSTGAMRTIMAVLPPLSRRTLTVNAWAPRASTAIRVDADDSLVVERAQYADGNGHIVAGAAEASTHWYMSEGYVGAGYADGLRLFNPYDATATVTITVGTRDGARLPILHTVAGGTRLNLSLDDFAPAGPSALALQSDAPIVVESVVRGGRRLAPSGAMALTGPSPVWYFPDGSTAAGNEEYLTVFNPNPARATVDLYPVTADGYQPRLSLHVGPYARAVYVLGGLIRRNGLGAVVRANRPVVAQMIRYTTGGAVALLNGTPSAALRWGLAEGYIGQGYREWVTLLNPSGRTATITVRLLTAHQNSKVVTVAVLAHHRTSLYLNDLLPAGPAAGVIASDVPVVVGRTLIFNSGAGLSMSTGTALPSGAES
jgi:hypothetical protein